MPLIETVVRPAYHPYRVRVARVERLSPHFVRTVFTADDLEHFGLGGPDQRIKVVLPHDDGTYADFGQDEQAGDWYDRWRALPDAERNPFRTYTVRGIDATARELIVDFVIHHDAGPAGAWAEQAVTGQELIIVGPDTRSAEPLLGFDWRPGTARRLLLAGDETAAPAIACILESLDSSFGVDAFIEVPTVADVFAIAHHEDLRVRWLPRGDRAHGAALTDALTSWAEASADLLARAAAPRTQQIADVDVDRELLWDSPEDVEGEFYAWIAGEAATVKTLRRLLVSAHGIDRKRVAFMGYWRLGQAERTE